ncbi:MAG TPA: histone deacetylase family protein [Thermoanaerobaculia bacterium]|nr:histone deacetylase family protein [Thermoanaerobaculia bacterium]
MARSSCHRPPGFLAHARNDKREGVIAGIRFILVADPDLESRRVGEVQRIFRSFYGEHLSEYADQIPDLLRRQPELGYRVFLMTAEQLRGRVIAFALAFHFPKLNSSLLDFIVVDPEARQRGAGGALYEALRDFLTKMGSNGLYLEVRPDAPEDEPDPKIRRENAARIRFYERLGVRVLRGTDYERRRRGRTTGEPYLMFDPLGPERVPSADEVRGMIQAILFRKYRYPPDDEYANAVINSVSSETLRLEPPRTGPAAAPKPAGDSHPVKVILAREHELHHIRERGYVERPVRVHRISHAVASLPGAEMVPVQPHEVGPILAVHDHDFVDYLERVCRKLPPGEAVYPYVFPIRMQHRKPVDEAIQAGYYCIDTFTPLTRNAWIAARAAVDCALTGADLIAAGERLVYAICRPPGHHAERRVYGGFCYFNNAAIAANELSKLGTVAVLDIDFHHGNGTQDIFWERADVLTISIHGDPSYAYPYFGGFADERGAGEGEGMHHNFPLPEDVGDDQYLEVLANALRLIEVFNPRNLVVSAGLDIAKGDPTGAWLISPAGLERIGAAIGALRLPSLVVQEGGYDSRVLGRNARQLIGGLQRGLAAD